MDMKHKRLNIGELLFIINKLNNKTELVRFKKGIKSDYSRYCMSKLAICYNY
jgi:hypothetical protein